MSEFQCDTVWLGKPLASTIRDLIFPLRMHWLASESRIAGVYSSQLGLQSWGMVAFSPVKIMLCEIRNLLCTTSSATKKWAWAEWSFLEIVVQWSPRIIGACLKIFVALHDASSRGATLNWSYILQLVKFKQQMRAEGCCSTVKQGLVEGASEKSVMEMCVLITDWWWMNHLWEHQLQNHW